MGTKKDSKETGKGEVTAKDIKVVIEALNKFLKKKKMTVCVIGKNKATGMKNFEAMIDSLEEDVAGKLPEKVIDFYNDNFGEEEETEEKPEKSEKKDKKADKKKADKKDKPKKEKKVSNEQLAKDMLEAGESEKAILAAFTKRYKERGNTDKDYIAKRVAIYIHIGKKALGMETTSPTAKKKDDKKADKKTDKKADKKKSDKKADKKKTDKKDKKGKK